MPKKQMHIRASLLTRVQTEDLKRWWEESTTTAVFAQAVSMAWHQEKERQDQAALAAERENEDGDGIL